MRKYFLILLFVPFLLASCLDVQSDYSPTLYVNHIINQSGDTLSVRYNETYKLNVCDTVHVGDTLNTLVLFDGVGNNITMALVNWDNSAAHVWTEYDNTVSSILLEKSDSVNCQLYFPEGYRYVLLPIHYVPLVAGSPVITFVVDNDSKYEAVEASIMIPAINSEE